MAVGVYYISWRLYWTVLPADAFTLGGGWIWFCFILEFIAWIESLIFWTLMGRTRNNSPPADEYEAMLRALPRHNLPTVDIYITTYNEGWDVLEKTIVGAKHVDWPKDKLTIWILDDGKRDAIKEQCKRHNLGYISRNNNHGAKAGNINHALKVTKGDFVLFLDADFIPYKNFLFRTIGFFKDSAIAIVQTPQTFFNKDFVQTNLGLHAILPDDQRFFFEDIMPSRDAWNVAFFCGSCAVARHDYLLQEGNLPLECITEDILLSMKLIQKGKITRFLCEKLSHGLAAENLAAFSTQRQRWCRGGIQTLFLKEGPLGPHHPLVSRLFFLPLHWIIHPFIKISVLVIPIVFLLTDSPPMVLGDAYEIIKFQTPYLLISYASMFWIAPWHFVPIITLAYENITAINLLPTIFHALVDPFGVGFKVTPKGQSAGTFNFHSPSLYTSLGLFFLTLVGMVMNVLPQTAIVKNESFFPIAFLWCFINLIILGLMIFLSIEKPRHRKEERFPVNEIHTLSLGNDSSDVFVHDLSLSGARLEFLSSSFQNQLNNTTEIPLIFISGLMPMPLKIIRQKENICHVSFIDQTEQQRHYLIQFLFTGAYTNDQHKPKLGKLLRGLFTRTFGRH
jgi:cellulose synthase (UDP-forming)